MADKNVTIRLEADDKLTPVLRQAGATALATSKQLGKLESETAAGAGSLSRFGEAAGRAGRAMRGTSSFGAAASAIAATSNAATRGTGSLAGFASSGERTGRVGRALRDELGGLTPLIAGVGLSVVGAARSFIEFDKAMAAVGANADASGEQLARLRALAQQLGADTQYSGAEAAQGINELAKAGVSADAILSGGLKGALNLAAAGQMEVADAAEAAASAMTMFGKEGGAVPHIADMLATAANTATGSVHDMTMALNQTGVVASGAGLSIEETVGALTTFAQAGFIGSDAGTSFKTMLQRITAPTEGAATTMENLGITVYDASGNFTGIVPVLEQFQTGLSGLSDEQKNAALQTIFGADAIRAYNVVAGQGIPALKANIAAMGEYGVASEQARKLTDHLAGDWERLGGAFDEVVLSSGSGVNSFLRDLVQLATKAVEVIGGVPEPVLQTVTAFAALNTVGRMLPNFGETVSRWKAPFQEFNANLQAAKANAATTAAGLRVLGDTTATVGQKFVGSSGTLNRYAVDVSKTTSALSTYAQAAGRVPDISRTMSTTSTSLHAVAAASKTQSQEFVKSANAAAAVNASMVPLKGTAQSTGSAMTALSGAAGQAAPKMGVLGGALAAVGGPAGAFRAAGSSLVAFLGGPWGVAFAAAGVAVSVLGGKLAEASARQREYAGVAEAVASATGYSGDVWGQAAQQAYIHSDAVQSVGKQLRDLNYSSGFVTTALLSEGDARRQIITDIDAQIAALQTETRMVTDSSGASTMWVNANQGRIDSLLATREGLIEVAGQASLGIEQAREGAAANSQIAAATGQASGALKGQAGALADVGEAAAKSEEDIKAFDTAMKRLLGISFGIEEATDAWHAGLKKVGEAAREAGGNLEKQTEAGRDVREAFRSQVEAAGDVIRAYASTGASSEQLQAKTNEMVAQLRKTGSAAGVTSGEMQRYTDTLQLIPQQVQTEVTVHGGQQALTQIGDVSAALTAVPGMTSLQMMLLGAAQAQSGLAGVRAAADSVPSEKSTVVSAPGAGQAAADIARTSIAALALPGQAHVAVAALGVAQAQAGLRGVTADAKTTDAQSPNVSVSETGAARTQGQLKNTTGTSKELDRQSPNVSVSETGSAPTQGRLRGVTRESQTVDRQSPNVRVTETGTSGVMSRLRGLWSFVQRSWNIHVRAGGSLPFAHGGIIPRVQPYADGGIERHIAQIAPAGAWRVWAEDETGGEAYIPLSPAKRARSSAILEEVARMFGYSLIRQAEGGLVGFANGAITARLADVSPFAQLQGLSRLPVQAVVTDVVMQKGVKVPFLYTPGGPWDRSVQLASVNTGTINTRFQDAFTTKGELAELAKRVGVAPGAPPPTLVKTAVAPKLTGALGSAKAKQFLPTILAMASKYGVPAELIAAVIQKESGWSTVATSKAGARGLMQLMPGTFRGLGIKGSITDPKTNIEAGTKYLAQMLNRFGGSIEKALAAYNAGPARAANGSWTGIKETRNYVNTITKDAGVIPLGRTVNSAAAKTNAAALAQTAAGKIVNTVKATNKLVVQNVKSKLTPQDARSAALINALAMEGQGKYVWGGGHGATDYKNINNALAADCSGFVGTVVGNALGKNVTSTASGMLRGNKTLGWVKIDPKLAAKTAGAILGNTGHVVLSLGDGRVVEHYKSGKPVRVRAIADRDMKMAAWNTGFGDIRNAGAVNLAGTTVTAGTPNAPSAEDIAAYARALESLKTPAYRHLAVATQQSAKYSRQFLRNIETIADRGYPEVAARLLEMGEQDGAEPAASFATAPASALRQQRANYAESAKMVQLQIDLERRLSSYAGPPAWITATRESHTRNQATGTFLRDVNKIADMGYLDLAFRLLDMGEDDAGDIARQAAAMKPGQDLRNMTARLATDVATNAALQTQVQARIQLANLAHTTRTANTSSSTFLGNIRKLRDRGYGDLALRLMEQGEAEAGPLAQEAAAATDAALRGIDAANKQRDTLQDEADRLLADLRGIGQVLQIAVGVATGEGPRVSWTSARAPDYRPADATRLAPQPHPVASGSISAGPLVAIGTMTTTDPAAAATALSNKLSDTLAVTGIRR